MSQNPFNLTDEPQSVAGAGAAMFQGRDSSVMYWIADTAPEAGSMPFTIKRGLREPITVPDGQELWLAGKGLAVVYSTTDPA